MDLTVYAELSLDNYSFDMGLAMMPNDSLFYIRTNYKIDSEANHRFYRISEDYIMEEFTMEIEEYDQLYYGFYLFNSKEKDRAYSIVCQQDEESEEEDQSENSDGDAGSEAKSEKEV
jgi:hypothetical protein